MQPRAWWSGVCAGLVAFGFVARPSPALACPCSDNPGSSGPLTTTRDRAGIALSESASAAHGVWDASGRYSRFDGSRGSLFWTLAGAVRPVPRLELHAELGAGTSYLRSTGFEAEHRGLSDTTFGAFYDAFDEPMPYERAPWPSLTVLARVRLPTGGTASESSTGSTDSTGGRSGLGAYEATLGFRAAKALTQRNTLSASAELSLRLPDESLGADRQLGPRAFGMLAITRTVSPELSVELSTSLTWEGDVAFRGERVSGTAQRLWNVEAAAIWTIRDGLGATASAGGAPPVDSVSRNTLGGVRGGVSLTYVF
jgi:hypothetical protein